MAMMISSNRALLSHKLPSLGRRNCFVKCYSSQQKENVNQASKAYKFIASAQSPNKLSLDHNLNPVVMSPRTRRILKPVVILGIFGLVYFFYLAFNSEYNLEMEENLMKALPGYESSMMENERYREAIEKLRRQRDENSRQ